MTIVTKDVKTLVEIKSLDGQEGRSLVMFDASTGEPLALDMDILIDLMKRDGSNANVASLAFNTALPLEDCPIGAIRWNSEKGVIEYRITTDSYIPLGFLRGSSDVYMPVVVDGSIPVWDNATSRFVAFDLSTYMSNVSNNLAAKAAHGYASSPKTLKQVDDDKAAHGYIGAEPQKTLKQVDDEVIQLAGDVKDATEKPTAQSLSELNARITALEAILSNKIKDRIDVTKEFNVWGKTNLILYGDGANTKAPDFIGQKYIDTTNSNVYVAVGNSNAGNWKLV